jgi:hypothetical protein
MPGKSTAYTVNACVIRGTTNWKWSSCVRTVCIRTSGGPLPLRRYRTRPPSLNSTWPISPLVHHVSV